MRPQKIRIIDAVPPCTRYVPEGRHNAAEMCLSLDMYEALRLVDAEGMAQEAAARRMEISTPTLCRLLGEARRRVASALRDGWAICCDGGNVSVRPCGKVCHGQAPSMAGMHGRGHCGIPPVQDAGGHARGRGCGMGRRQQMQQQEQNSAEGEE